MAKPLRELYVREVLALTDITRAFWRTNLPVDRLFTPPCSFTVVNSLIKRGLLSETDAKHVQPTANGMREVLKGAE